jgi:hypothetical protein
VAPAHLAVALDEAVRRETGAVAGFWLLHQPWERAQPSAAPPSFLDAAPVVLVVAVVALRASLLTRWTWAPAHQACLARCPRPRRSPSCRHRGPGHPGRVACRAPGHRRWRRAAGLLDRARRRSAGLRPGRLLLAGRLAVAAPSRVRALCTHAPVRPVRRVGRRLAIRATARRPAGSLQVRVRVRVRVRAMTAQMWTWQGAAGREAARLCHRRCRHRGRKPAPPGPPWRLGRGVA